jgi:long-chain acyl-CoA synthetase
LKCSGTTGAPKGAVLTQAQSVAVIYSIVAVGSADTFAKVDHTDCYISYLPLAHVFERAAQGLFVYTGGSIGYYQVRASNGRPHAVQAFTMAF